MDRWVTLIDVRVKLKSIEELKTSSHDGDY